MFSLLKELVLIQSGSYHKAGVDAVVEVIRDVVSREGLSARIVEQEKLGNHLIVTTRASEEGKRGLLIVGHTDTVFPEDTPFRWYREDDENVYGPGVIDMKGGSWWVFSPSRP
jgi:glutamate carboxypeptidase